MENIHTLMITLFDKDQRQFQISFKLIYFFNSWSVVSTKSRATLGSAASSGSSSSMITCSSSLLVQFGDDGIANAFDFFLLVLEFINFSSLIVVKPVECLIALLRNCVLVVQSGFHIKAIGLETIFGCDAFFLLVIIFLEFFGFGNHLFNFISTETAFVIGDGDFFLL